MRLKVVRYDSGPQDTLGKLYINDRFASYTLEDEYRKVKVKGDTRIPEGSYRITFRNEGGFNMKYSHRFPDMHKGMLWVRDVPNFQYVLIHIGNTEDDTAGCLLVGDKTGTLKGKRAILGSSSSYKKIYPIVANALSNGEEVSIEYINKDNNPEELQTPSTSHPIASLQKKTGSKYLWILDSGKDEIYSNHFGSSAWEIDQYMKHELNGKIIQALKKKLQGTGISYYESSPPSLNGSIYSRIRRANELSKGKPKFLVSFQSGQTTLGNRNSKIGLETFYFPGSKKGQLLAEEFQSKLASRLQLVNKGIKTSKASLLRKTKMPAIISKMELNGNYRQFEQMMDGGFINKSAEAHFNTIQEIEGKSNF
ncbi:DUF5675 family protein [Xanthovirga aplysinae]|uniref:DUF5675 family protein n=1 Tax=Xanthovirga aplysinae TaxID=2529853 RepID=UPI0012BC05E0|nr:DUF5675 family protein [Xanthovirga aplysinae]MTI29777.1 hypothetical protein [Xanthovirga aplysinae]